MQYFEEYTEEDKLHEIVKLRLVIFREFIGHPCTITAGYAVSGHSENSEHYNVDIKQNPNSLAVDITTKAPLWWAYICAERAKFENIGIYPAWNGLHLGVRGHDSRRWIGTGADNTQTYLPYCIDTLANILFKKT